MHRALMKLLFTFYIIITCFTMISWPSTTTCVMAGAIRAPRLSLADWNNYNYREPQGAGTYAFGYDIDDSATGNVQFRDEERHPNGTVTGSYGYVAPDGTVHAVTYVADENGYRATVDTNRRLAMLKPIVLPESPYIRGNPSVAFPSSFEALTTSNDKFQEPRRFLVDRNY